MKKAETRNPLIMMDEIDKMSRDFRGDPASALLEVLDPEQNDSFRDHYLDFEYDLSQVIFITTANTLSSIPQPLIDRMEVIELPGYTAFEKINIATKHLVPKVLSEHDLHGKLKINYQKAALEKIIKLYTREAGVRSLERQIAKILRKVVKKWCRQILDGLAYLHSNHITAGATEHSLTAGLNAVAITGLCSPTRLTNGNGVCAIPP